MRRRLIPLIAAASAAAGLILVPTAPAQADVDEWLTSDRYPRPGDPGCESIPFLGLNPYIRSICDGPIRPDGSWLRYRALWGPERVHSTCGGNEYYSDGWKCPSWAPHDTIPAFGNEVTYIVTPDTVPPGEPGYLG